SLDRKFRVRASSFLSSSSPAVAVGPEQCWRAQAVVPRTCCWCPLCDPNNAVRYANTAIHLATASWLPLWSSRASPLLSLPPSGGAISLLPSQRHLVGSCRSDLGTARSLHPSYPLKAYILPQKAYI